jgi:DNA-binding LacI/PurR family transcriptional regulator
LESKKIKVTLKTVADRAGVSPTAVSLLLSGRTTVCTPDTAQRIFGVIDELGYRTPRLRRSVPAPLPSRAELIAVMQEMTEGQQRIIWALIEALRQEALTDVPDVTAVQGQKD